MGKGPSSRSGGLARRVNGWPAGQLEAAALVGVPVLLLVQWVLAGLLDSAFGPAAGTVYAAVALVLLALVMFAGDAERSVPVVVPTAVAAVATVVLAGLGSPWAAVVVVAAAVWLGAWFLAWGRLWAVWTIVVLRRRVIWQDPFAVAYTAVHAHLHAAASVEDIPAVWAEAVALNEHRSFATAGLIDGTLAEFDLGARESDSWRAERLTARLVDELRDYECHPDRDADRDPHPERPTRGTRLEFLFPELEALLAAATPAQQRRVAVEAARAAGRRAGILDDHMAAALDRAGDGRPDADARARFEPAAPPEGGDQGDGYRATFEAESARTAAWFALAESLDPTDAAEGVYEAARTMDDRELEALVAAAGSVLDDAARGRATRIEPSPEALEKVRAKRQAPAEEWDPASLLRWARSLGEVALLGLAAGALGTALRVPFAPLLEPLPHSASLDNLLGIALVAMSAWAILRVARRPTGASAVVGLYLASWLAAVLLVEPVEAASDALLTRLAPGLWSAVYQDPATVLVYAPQHAVAFAAALLAIAVLLRRDASQRRPTDTAAA